MGSSYSTYLEQNCAPDLFHIVVWPGDLIKVSKIAKTYHGACNKSKRFVEHQKITTVALHSSKSQTNKVSDEQSKELATGALYVGWESTILGKSIIWGTNGVPMARHGLILSQDGATGSNKILKYLQGLRDTTVAPKIQKRTTQIQRM